MSDVHNTETRPETDRKGLFAALGLAGAFLASACALCPVTVKAAMSGVEGVTSVEIDFPARTAHVLFDPSVTDAAAIAQASEQAGYPAAVQG